MAPPTIAIRVMEELRRSRRPLDDDELARRLGVSPRQSIYQVCRKLAQAGRLRRYVGPDGKIVNDPRQVTSPEPSGTPQENPGEVRQAGGDVDVARPQPETYRSLALPAGHSQEQRTAERVMLRLLGERLGVALAPKTISLADRVRVVVDGASDDLSILVEAWAHQGTPKSAQKHKVLADTLKLLYVASTLGVSSRLVLCLSDHIAAHHFTEARSWAAIALRDFGVEVMVVDLPKDVRAAVLAAQKRQFR